MPVKKTTEKKATTKATVKKAVSKPVNKTVEVKTEKVTKPHVVVETKKIDVCDKSCNCGEGCACKCCTKAIIFILVAINLVLALILCIRNCNRGAWAIETMKDGWKANMEKVIQLYESDYYIDAQKQSIESYSAQLSAE